MSDGVLSRTVAETALLLDVLAGYEPGDATWAPRPVEPYTLAMRRDPGKLRIAMTLANALDVDADPEVVHGLHSAAELLRDLGHEVVDDSPAMPGPESLDIFLQVFGPGIALGIGLGERLAGRPPDDDEIEPMSRALHELARALPSTGYLTAVAQLQLLARGTVAFFADYDVLLTPVLAERPLPIGELHGCGPIRSTTCAARAGSRRTPRCSTSPASPRSRCPSGSPRMGSRPPCSSSATRWARRLCCSSRRRSRPRAHGPTAGRPWPSASDASRGRPPTAPAV